MRVDRVWMYKRRDQCRKTEDNGKPDTKTELAKALAAKSNVAKVNDSKKQVKAVDLKKKEDDESDDDDDDSDDSDDDENESSDEDLIDADDSDDEDESDEEETPKKGVKVDKGKKRLNDSAAKTPVSAKKAKASTPQKTDGKKGGHTATPHPMKKGGKSPNSDAKSGGHLSCKSCSKTFNSDGGLQHIKAKHT